MTHQLRGGKRPEELSAGPFPGGGVCPPSRKEKTAAPGPIGTGVMAHVSLPGDKGTVP